MSKELKPCPDCGDLPNGADCSCAFQKPLPEIVDNTRTPHLPDREEVARALNEEFGRRPWDDVPSDRRERKIWATSNRLYAFDEDSKEDFLISADRILSLMERKA